MAWNTTRKETLPPDWPRLRLAVFERDGHQCTYTRRDTGRRCSETKRLECDHVGDRMKHSMDNLTTLCHWHHLRKSGSQGGKAAALRPRRELKLPTETHPGIVTNGAGPPWRR